MKKITAISVQKKNPNRVNIYLDGEYAFGVARITAAWLKNGDELSDEKISKLLAEDAREWAYQQALLYLSYRARSEKEIRQNLRKHEMPEEVIEETIERLHSAVSGVDEEALAYEAAQKRLGRLKGLEWNEFRKKLSEFLARRGFPYSVIAPIVTRLWSEVHMDDQAKNFEDEDIS